MGWMRRRTEEDGCKRRVKDGHDGVLQRHSCFRVCKANNQLGQAYYYSYSYSYGSNSSVSLLLYSIRIYTLILFRVLLFHQTPELVVTQRVCAHQTLVYSFFITTLQVNTV